MAAPEGRLKLVCQLDKAEEPAVTVTLAVKPPAHWLPMVIVAEQVPLPVGAAVVVTGAAVVVVTPELTGAAVVVVTPDEPDEPDEGDTPEVTESPMPGEEMAPGNGNWMLWSSDCFCVLTIPL